MTEKHEPKSITSAELIAHSQAREERARRVQLAGRAYNIMAQVADSVDQMIPLLEAFNKERQRLGEYDASAAAIMEIAEMNLKIVKLNRAWIQAHIDLILEGL